MFRILNEKSTKKPYEDMVRGRNKSLPNKDETRNGYRVRETATEYAPCNSSLKLQKYYLYSSNFFSMLLIIMFSFSPQNADGVYFPETQEDVRIINDLFVRTDMASQLAEGGGVKEPEEGGGGERQ